MQISQQNNKEIQIRRKNKVQKERQNDDIKQNATRNSRIPNGRETNDRQT